jgi:hypothetical protein
MFDITPFLMPGDPWLPDEKPETIKKYYEEKYAVAVLLKPKFIVEIGIRAGYSAAAFLSACPNSRYEGFDIDCYQPTGPNGCVAYASRMLPSRFKSAVITIHNHNTQERTWKLQGIPDLVHVDGDHTTLGCISDIELARSWGARYVLIDDYTYIQSVRDGIDIFLRNNVCKHIYLPTFRGDVLIQF